MEERSVRVGDLTVHVRGQGRGVPLMLLHHSTGPHWGRFQECLSLGFEVMAPDMPGYGRSCRPETARHPAHLAVLLHQLLDAEDRDEVHLVGLGLGGWVAAEMAAMNQRRLASLTLVGAAGIRPRNGSFIHDPMAESWTDYARRSFRDDEHFEAVYGADPPTATLEAWDHSREMTARIAWRPWMWSQQLPALLRGVDVRTLVIWGGEDRVVPIDSARQYLDALGNASLRVVEGAGHAVELEQPERVAALIIYHARG